MIDEEQRQRIIDEIQDLLEIEEVPAYALTRKELKTMLRIGDVALDSAFADLKAQGRLNQAYTYRNNIRGHPYRVEVYWTDDEESDLHKKK